MNRENLDNIREIFSLSANTIHKARNEIRIILFEDRELVVKSFKVPHFLNRIIYTFFRDSKAKRSYDYSIKLGSFAPNPMGYKIYKKFGLIEQSYFVSEKFEYDFTIKSPLFDSNFENREEILIAFTKFTYQLHQSNILHLDYSPGNILIKKEKKEYSFKIVDINRMKFKKLSLNERLKNFSKLWAKDEDICIIAEEYAKLIDRDKDICIKKALNYTQKDKDMKNLKNILKGRKIIKRS
ncbi:MAG: lipopolysaccharide kinase InaA family protein [Sulfurovum sp.]